MRSAITVSEPILLEVFDEIDKFWFRVGPGQVQVGIWCMRSVIRVPQQLLLEVFDEIDKLRSGVGLGRYLVHCMTDQSSGVTSSLSFYRK